MDKGLQKHLVYVLLQFSVFLKINSYLLLILCVILLNSLKVFCDLESRNYINSFILKVSRVFVFKCLCWCTVHISKTPNPVFHLGDFRRILLFAANCHTSCSEKYNPVSLLNSIISQIPTWLVSSQNSNEFSFVPVTGRLCHVGSYSRTNSHSAGRANSAPAINSIELQRKVTENNEIDEYRSIF